MEAGKKSPQSRPPRKSKSPSSARGISPSNKLQGTPQPYILRHYDRWAEHRFGRLTPYLFRCYHQRVQRLSKKRYHRSDEDMARQIGRNMRFFLNSAVLWLVVYSFALAMTLKPMSAENLLLAGIPIFIGVIFFLVFLIMLKRVEVYAAKRRNIDLVSRTIWELNKSTLIRCTIGRIPTFLQE